MAEQAAAGYMYDMAPDATIRQVFDDLYVRGAELATSLQEQVDDGCDPSTRQVPGTPIEIGYGHSLDDENETWRDFTLVSAGRLPNHKDLYYVAEEGPANIDPEERPSTPAKIAGFRSDRPFMPTYSLDVRASGMVVSSIKSPLWVFKHEGPDTRYESDQPFAGSTANHPQAEVAGLDKHEQKRLRLITNAIALGIARTEMLREGADFDAMFGIEPERQPIQRPVKRFSLKWLLGGHSQPA